MRIEIVVDNQDPVIFPLNKPRLLIGSQETCDIVISTRGISRKHLSVIVENDSYFVIDQGSTNGSYINEERLVPGKKTEFTSFFPVRLGLNVLLILISDEEANGLGFNSALKNLASSSSSQSSEGSESTKVISLKDLKSSSATDSLLKKKQDSVLKRKSALKPPPKKTSDKTRMLYVKLLSAILFGGSLYWQLFLNAPEMIDEVPASKVQKFVSPKAQKVIPLPPRFPLVDDSVLVTPSKLATIEKDIHCTNDIEKYFCDSMTSPTKSAVQVGTSIFIFFDGNLALQKAKEMIRPPVPADGVQVSGDDWLRFDNDVRLTAALYSLSLYLPKDLNYAIIGDYNLVFVMKTTNNNQSEMFSLAFVPASLKKFLSVLEPRHFELAQKYNAQVFNFLNEYYRAF